MATLGSSRTLPFSSFTRKLLQPIVFLGSSIVPILSIGSESVISLCRALVFRCVEIPLIFVRSLLSSSFFLLFSSAARATLAVAALAVSATTARAAYGVVGRALLPISSARRVRPRARVAFVTACSSAAAFATACSSAAAPPPPPPPPQGHVVASTATAVGVSPWSISSSGGANGAITAAVGLNTFSYDSHPTGASAVKVLAAAAAVEALPPLPPLPPTSTKNLPPLPPLPPTSTKNLPQLPPLPPTFSKTCLRCRLYHRLLS